VFDAQGVVDVQNVNRHATDRCFADERRTVPFEVLAPVVCARIEQADEFIEAFASGCDRVRAAVTCSAVGSGSIRSNSRRDR
jgi:hypothetical protein